MSNYDDDFLKSLEQQIGGGEKKEPAKSSVKLIDPASGKEMVYDDPNLLQQDVNRLYQLAREANSQLRALKEQPKPGTTEPKPAPEAKSGSGVLSESDLAEFQRLTAIDPGTGMNFLIEKLPATRSTHDAIRQIAGRMQQFEQALSATTFLGSNQAVAQDPERQKAVGEVLNRMGVQVLGPEHYKIALAAAKSEHPELFADREPTPGNRGDGGFRQSGYVPPPPSPPRQTTSPQVPQDNIEEMINKLIDTQGFDAARAFLSNAGAKVQS